MVSLEHKLRQKKRAEARYKANTLTIYYYYVGNLFKSVASPECINVFYAKAYEREFNFRGIVIDGMGWLNFLLFRDLS